MQGFGRRTPKTQKYPQVEISRRHRHPRPALDAEVRSSAEAADEEIEPAVEERERVE
ncbi:unnamed protein product, partial [Larinioides sclopetarius]